LKMLLYELAYACRIYAATFDEALKRFRSTVEPKLDLENAGHRAALLKWLNEWGCRHLAKKHHGKASDELLRWWREQRRGDLPKRDLALAELSAESMDTVEKAYASLAQRAASLRAGKSGEHQVTFGPTGASKVMYALWPEALVPWDDAIRLRLHLGGEPRSYRTFLAEIVPGQIETLRVDAARFGIRLSDVPVRVGRQESSLPKLVDEFFWVTITQNCAPPASATIQEWARWAS
jgi:hypothetical protein